MTRCKCCGKEMGIGEASIEYCDGFCSKCYKGEKSHYYCEECGMEIHRDLIHHHKCKKLSFQEKVEKLS